MDTPVLDCWNRHDLVSHMPQRRPYISSNSSFATSMGSPLFDSHRPRLDADSVQGLRESGAVIPGKTVSTEFASLNCDFGKIKDLEQRFLTNAPQQKGTAPQPLDNKIRSTIGVGSPYACHVC